MGHLTAETLARLVDNPAEPHEARHLEECEACTAELAALVEQTEALGALPEILPPAGDWQFVEARLRSEGLIEDEGLVRKLGLAHTPTWMRTAAALVLFLAGAGSGMAMTSQDSPEAIAELAMSDPAIFASSGTVEEAASAVRVAEQAYMAALTRYQELLGSQDGSRSGVDPMSRYAALEHLAAVSQAAVRQAPGDPYFNGLLASVLGEREAAMRLVSNRDNWF